MKDDPQAILDELLALKCRRGDAAAWQELVKRYERRLFYFIRRLVNSERDAWDLLQQTWLAAIQSVQRLNDPRAVRTWLYRIARNLAISHLRRSGAPVTYVDPADLQEFPQTSDEANSDDDSWFADAAERVHVAMSRLSVPHREVLTLHFLEDASVEEIANVIGVPAGTVKSRLFYAKRAIRAVIEQPRQESP